jgi:hypothetical protein
VNREVRPSELFRDHIFGCFISDSAGIYTGHLIGVDNIMVEGDYPHSDSNWPHTSKVLEEVMRGVPDDEARKMVELNAFECVPLSGRRAKDPTSTPYPTARGALYEDSR